MSIIVASFPGAIWDGTTENPYRDSIIRSVDPDQHDWDRITAEMIAVQVVVDTLDNLGVGQATSFDAGTVAAPGLHVTGDANTGLYSPSADQMAIATAGVQRILVTTTGVTTTVPMIAPVGAVGTPSVTFAGDLNTGFYWIGADEFGIATGGTLRVSVSTTAITATLPVVVGQGLVGTPSVTFAGDLNTGVYSPGADQVAITTAGVIRVHVDAVGNVLLAGASAGTDAVGVISIPNGVAPTSSPANTCQLYSEGGELKVRDAGGTVTVISDAAAGGASLEVSKTNDNAGTINIGQPVYSKSDGDVDLARANAAGTAEVLGLVSDTTILTTAAGDIQTAGTLTATTGQWDAVTGQSGGLTSGAVYFLSAATAGLLTTTAPTTVGQLVTRVGIAHSTTKMEIRVTSAILL